MALPKVETPTYELTLPSQDLQVKYRPFLVREEKILMMANEAGEKKDITHTTMEVLQSCTFNEIDIQRLPLFDIEYLFLNIRAKSVGEKAKFKILCKDDMETYAEVEVDLTKIDVQVDDSHTNDVVLDEERKLGVVFAYPTYVHLKNNVNIEKMDVKTTFNMISGCIDHIYEGEKIYPSKDTTEKERMNFLESLNGDQFDKLRKFFETMPTLKHEVEVENPKTKVKNKVSFSGLSDFFTSASPITR